MADPTPDTAAWSRGGRVSEVRCRRTINDGKARCPWRGELDDVPAHAAETGHVGCLVCRWPLGDEDIRCCARCVNRVRDHLADIEDAFHTLPAVMEATCYHQGSLPGGDALVLLGAGSTQGGGLDDHPRFRDPIPLLADLHTWEREWREEFGHDHFPRWRATVPSTLGYLRTWLWLATRTHDAVDDFMRDISELRDRALHVAGLADDPEKAAARCFDCDQRGRLERRFGDQGLEDSWTCRACGSVYDQTAYFLALRAAAATEEGYVPLADAARAARISAYMVRNWYDRGQLSGYCQVFPSHRHYVWWPDVHDRVSERNAG